MGYAGEHCKLDCNERPCGFSHCDRFSIEQQHPEWVRVDSGGLDAVISSRCDLASGTFVDGRLLSELLGRVPPG